MFLKKLKKWNSILTFLSLLCKFEENLSTKVALVTNGLMVKTLHNVRVVHIYELGWSDITTINGENVAQCTSSTYLCTRVE